MSRGRRGAPLPFKIEAVDNCPDGAAYLLPSDLVAKLKLARTPAAEARVVSEIHERIFGCARIDFASSSRRKATP